MYPKRPITAALLLLTAGIASAQKPDFEKEDIEVSAQANVYYHDIDKNKRIYFDDIGVEPIEIDVSGFKTITFENDSGKVTCFSDVDTVWCGADGGIFHDLRTNVTGEGPLSGITHRKKVMFLVGVFLSEYSRLDPQLPAIDWTKEEDFHAYGPALNQVFFIGDGKAGDGTTQRLLVPSEANVLYIGFADCLEGPPKNYNDNRGSIKITVVKHRTDKGRN